MQIDEFILITVPLTLLTSYILKVIFIRKMPPLEDILEWAYRSVEFHYGTEVFNTVLDKLLKYNRYTVQQRKQDSIYLVESPLKWQRMGFLFYIVHNANEKMVRIYFKTIFKNDSQNAKVIEEMLTYFHDHGTFKIVNQ
jgi:hypothetical protein